MTMRRALFALCLAALLPAGNIFYRVVLQPPAAQTFQGVTFALSARAYAEYIVVTADIRNDSAETFILNPEQVLLSGERSIAINKADFFWPEVLPDARENLVFRFRARPGEYVLRLKDLEFPLLIKASRPELPYYLERSTVYRFADGALWRVARGAGLLILDTGEELLEVWLKSGQDFWQVPQFDYASWLATSNISADYLLLKTKVSPDVFAVYDRQGRLLK